MFHKTLVPQEINTLQIKGTCSQVSLGNTRLNKVQFFSLPLGLLLVFYVLVYTIKLWVHFPRLSDKGTLLLLRTFLSTSRKNLDSSLETSVLPVGFNPWTSSLWIQCDQINDSRTFLGWKGYTQLYSHGGRSITRLLSTQSEFAESKPVSASGPLCPHSHLNLCPRRCHHSSLYSPAALQLCHHVAQSTGQGSLYGVSSNVLPTHV